MAARGEAPHRLDIAIGLRIRERRRYLGLSQNELSARLGISFQQIQKYERGANRVSFSRLVEIAAALGCELSSLADGLDPDFAPDQLEHANRLMQAVGAIELLEVYAALDDSMRRYLLQQARGLRTALEHLDR
jgi:transcriptional regulator with XRE-family HTH domain